MRIGDVEVEHREIDGVHCIGTICFELYKAGKEHMGWRLILDFDVFSRM
jgi:hypothetical protein